LEDIKFVKFEGFDYEVNPKDLKVDLEEPYKKFTDLLWFVFFFLASMSLLNLAKTVEEDKFIFFEFLDDDNIFIYRCCFTLFKSIIKNLKGV